MAIYQYTVKDSEAAKRAAKGTDTDTVGTIRANTKKEAEATVRDTFSYGPDGKPRKGITIKVEKLEEEE